MRSAPSNDARHDRTQVKRTLKAAAVVVAIVFAVLWFLFAFRFVALPVLIFLVIVLSRSSLRARSWLLAGVWIVFFAATIQPFDVTLRAVPVGPRIITWCPGPVPYANYRDVLERDRRGECRFRTDLFVGHQATYFLVW
jgi:hypothetical protein